MGVYLALDRLDIEHGLVVEAAAPDERHEGVEEVGCGVEVATDGAGLDEGGALPVLANGLVIGQGHRRRDDRRCRRRIGPKPEIDAEDVAVGGALLQQGRGLLGDAIDERLGLDAGRKGGGQPFRIEEERDIDVAGIVELERAVLAHGETEQAGDRPGGIVWGRDQLALSPLFARH